MTQSCLLLQPARPRGSGRRRSHSRRRCPRRPHRRRPPLAVRSPRGAACTRSCGRRARAPRRRRLLLPAGPLRPRMRRRRGPTRRGRARLAVRSVPHGGRGRRPDEERREQQGWRCRGRRWPTAAAAGAAAAQSAVFRQDADVHASCMHMHACVRRPPGPGGATSVKKLKQRGMG